MSSDILEILAAVVTVVGGLYTAFRLFVTNSRRKKERYREDILKQAGDQIAKVRAELEEKIKKVEIEVEVQKININKDFDNLKSSHNTEIKALAEKIENLRQDLQTQHRDLVGLLTKLVDSRKL
jgi:archaellum component FlaC